MEKNMKNTNDVIKYEEKKHQNSSTQNDSITHKFINQYHNYYYQILGKYRMLNDKQNKSNKFINSKFIDKNDIDRYINIDIEKDMCSDRVYIIKTLHDYMFFINNLLLSYTQGKREDKDKKYRRKYIFRGINNLYTIKSKLYNDNINIKDLNLYGKISSIDRFKSFEYYDNAIVTNEYELMRKFEENGSLKFKGYNTVNELIAFAKHYELKTRFVDWSYSPLIATLFAISEKPEIMLSQSERKVGDNNTNEDKYYCLMIRNYTSSLTINDLPICFNYTIDKNKYYEYPNAIKMIDELNSLSNDGVYNLNYWYKKYQRAMRIFNSIYKLVLLLDKVREGIKANKNIRNSQGKNIYDRLGDDFKKASKETCLGLGEDELLYCDIIYNYFETIYDLTNIVTNSFDKIKYVSIMTRKFVNGSKIILDAPICNERLRNQRGIFEIDTYESHSFQFQDPANYFMLISEKAKGEIIKYINSLGFNYYTIMDEPTNTSSIINKTVDGDYSFDREIKY